VSVARRLISQSRVQSQFGPLTGRAISGNEKLARLPHTYLETAISKDGAELSHIRRVSKKLIVICSNLRYVRSRQLLTRAICKPKVMGVVLAFSCETQLLAISTNWFVSEVRLSLLAISVAFIGLVLAPLGCDG